jgi:putative serine protease PepD
MSDDPLATYYSPAYPPTPAPAGPRRGGRVVAAALLVGALAGGAAGVGAASLVDSGGSTTVSTAPSSQPLAVAPANRTSAKGGTTESAAAKILPSVVKIYATSSLQSGSGSGIILTRDGEILTNNHVVALAANGGRLAVSFHDGKAARATIVGRDPLTDLAVIKAQGVHNLVPAKLGSSASLQVGEPVVAVGAPFGLDSTVTTGIVSALNRPVTAQSDIGNDGATIFPAIQTDAAINPGNSGGPLINLAGDVVGIDSAIQTAPSSAITNAQGGSIGLGFAIPIDEAIPIVNQLRAGQLPTHARIGVLVGDAHGKIGLPDGALVDRVDPDTPGAAAGLHKGDVITKVNDQPISDSNSLVATVRTYRPGDRVTLTVVSPSGGSRTVTLTLASDAHK